MSETEQTADGQGDAGHVLSRPQAASLSPMGLVDTHCHLSSIEESGEVSAEEVMTQALAQGMVAVVDVATDLATSEAAAARAAQLPGVVAAVGVHPHEAGSWGAVAAVRIGELLDLPGVVGIGETGLDYVRELAPRAAQREAFGAHIRLAAARDRTLIVHCRGAFDDVLGMLDGEGAPKRVVLHCFSGTSQEAARVVAAGYFVSFAGNVTFRNAPDLRAACGEVPLDRLLVETDSPLLSPHPLRGAPNRPWRVAVTAATVARVHGVSREALAALTTANASRAFAPPQKWVHG